MIAIVAVKAVDAAKVAVVAVVVANKWICPEEEDQPPFLAPKQIPVDLWLAIPKHQRQTQLQRITVPISKLRERLVGWVGRRIAC